MFSNPPHPQAKFPNALYFTSLISQHKYTGERLSSAQREERRQAYMANCMRSRELQTQASELGHIEAALHRNLPWLERRRLMALYCSVTGAEREACCWTASMANRYLLELRPPPGAEARVCSRPPCGFREGIHQVQIRQRCARCVGRYYCSTGCQLMDWPSHMHECVL